MFQIHHQGRNEKWLGWLHRGSRRSSEDQSHLVTPRHGKGVKGVKGLCLGMRGPGTPLRHIHFEAPESHRRSRLATENPGQKKGRREEGEGRGGRKGGGEEIEIGKARPANPTGESLQGDDRVGREDGSQ